MTACCGPNRVRAREARPWRGCGLPVPGPRARQAGNKAAPERSPRPCEQSSVGSSDTPAFGEAGFSNLPGRAKLARHKLYTPAPPAADTRRNGPPFSIHVRSKPVRFHINTRGILSKSITPKAATWAKPVRSAPSVLLLTSVPIRLAGRRYNTDGHCCAARISSELRQALSRPAGAKANSQPTRRSTTPFSTGIGSTFHPAALPPCPQLRK